MNNFILRFFLLAIIAAFFIPADARYNFLRAAEITFLENKNYSAVPPPEQFSSLFPERKYIDLNGEWEYRIGNESTWRTVSIPGCYINQAKLTFRKTFSVDSLNRDSQLRLYALGINYRCLITINGRIVGSHTGGYSSFLIDIPHRILDANGTNTLELEVDNRLDLRSTIPLEQPIWGWMNYGGIFREIFLVQYPKVSIDDAYVKYTFNENYTRCRLSVSLELRNNMQISRENEAVAGGIPLGNIPKVSCHAEIIEIESGKSIAQNAGPDTLIEVQRLNSGTIYFMVENPILWDFTNPKRYRIRVSIREAGRVLDIWSAHIGFRDIAEKDGSLFLNGDPLTLFGLSYFEDILGLGSAVNWKSVEENIVQMKDLGINCLLGGLYPCHPYLYTLCDTYGILIIESIPLWQVPESVLANPAYLELGKTYLQEMILRDRNHPSVLGWGLGMELGTASDAGKMFLTELHRKAKQLDYRPTIYTTAMLKDEPSWEIPDILGLSIRSYSTLENFTRSVSDALSRYKNKPVIIGRYGRELVPVNEEGLSQVTSTVELQAKFIEEAYQQLSHFSELDGHILWTFADWWGQKPLLMLPPQANPYLYSMGLLDYQRQERVSYRMVKALLSGDEHPTLNITTENQQESYIFQIVGLAVLALLVYTSKKSIRFGENIKRSIVYRLSFFTDVGTRHILPLIHTLFLSLVNSVVLAMLFSALLFNFRRSVTFDYFISQVLVWNKAKEIIIWLAWEPWAAILYASLFMFMGGLLLSSLLSLTKIATKKRIEWEQVYHIVIWSGSPIILLIPLAMTLYPALSYQGVLTFTIAVSFIFALWTFVRLFSGLSVIYNSSQQKIFLIFGTILLILVAVIIYGYQTTQGTIDFLKLYTALFFQ